MTTITVRDMLENPKLLLWSAVNVNKRRRESTKIQIEKSQTKNKTKRLKNNKGFIGSLIGGLLCLTYAILTLIWEPYDLVMAERLRMTRGLPSFEWWEDPPDEVLFRIFIFNITNSEEFLSGKENELKVEEIPPIVYMEKLYHTNVTFNDNGTMTYVAVRQPVYLPDMNTISLNDTIYVANHPILGIGSYLWNAPLTEKLGFSMLTASYNSKAIVKTTIYNFLWNFTDPLIPLFSSMRPEKFPTTNFGMLSQIYSNFIDEVTVKIGTDNGPEQFFLMDKFHGQDGLGLWDDKRCDTVKNSTEGVLYHNNVSKNDTLFYLRKTMCRITPLYFKEEEKVMGLTGYKFQLPNDTFSNKKELNKCFNTKHLPDLPDGLINVSPCNSGFPLAASFPHFLYAEQSAFPKISGMKPNESIHDSYVVLEPKTGVPLYAYARSQSNLVVKSLSSFSSLKKFSNMNVPMFWMEYTQVGLPWYVWGLMYFTLIVLPVSQTVFSCILLIIGFWKLIKTVRRINGKSKKSDKSKNNDSVIHYSSLNLDDNIRKCSLISENNLRESFL